MYCPIGEKRWTVFFFIIIIPAGGLTTVFALLAISLDVHPVVRRRRRSPSLLQIVANACAVTHTHISERAAQSNVSG